MGAADDRLDIMDLIGRYSFAADEGSGSDYPDVYTDTGAFHGRLGQPDEIRIEGRAAMQKWYSNLLKRRAPERQGRHHQSSTIFLEQTPETAHTMTYLLVTAVVGDGPPGLALSSVYEDLIVKTEDGWRIQERKVHPDVTGYLYPPSERGQ